MTDIVDRLKDACVGLPNAEIPWPHRLLHDAVAEIVKLREASEKVVSAALDDCIGGPCQPSQTGCARCPYEQPKMRNLRKALKQE